MPSSQKASDSNKWNSWDTHINPCVCESVFRCNPACASLFVCLLLVSVCVFVRPYSMHACKPKYVFVHVCEKEREGQLKKLWEHCSMRKWEEVVTHCQSKYSHSVSLGYARTEPTLKMLFYVRTSDVCRNYFSWWRLQLNFMIFMKLSDEINIKTDWPVSKLP